MSENDTPLDPHKLLCDVAIFSRWSNVEHARSLYELLRDRLDVFFSEERPEEFVGKDGEETFGYIFRDRSRIVVIFYAPDWGKTRFTRAEEAAIRQRAGDSGYGFTLWVPVGGAVKPPPYVPQELMWADWDELGPQGLAAIVEERVRESGLQVRELSPIDEIKRFAREQDLHSKREEFMRSRAGVEFFNSAVGQLPELVNERVAEIVEADGTLRFQVDTKPRRGGLVVRTPVIVMDITHKQPYIDAIKDASLAARFSSLRDEDDGRRVQQGMHTTAFTPGLDAALAPGWRSGDGEYYSIEEVARMLVDELALLYAKRISPEGNTHRAGGGLTSFR